MAAKTKGHPLNSVHTAGIFSDMAIDGPEIGTLVIVVDRAKNLPNRKTIGKQDPYCAARLGKEAKKTSTDIRGGQTPKWDQELRFVVHDSPDYYQLKVSVFNDDKKTELIGETWVDLRDIVVSGGGQSDQWHNLTCRGKYAGEIRVEITYYDSRPKPDKPVAAAARPKQVPVDEDRYGSLSRAGPRRRPLPSDPISGQPPAVAVPQVPEHVQTPPRPQPNPLPASYVSSQPSQQPAEYGAPPPPARHREQDHFTPAPPSGGAYATPNRMDAQPQHSRTPDGYDMYPAHLDEPTHSPDFDPHEYDPHDARTDHFDDRPVPFNVPPDDRTAPPPDDDRPPPPPVHRSRNNSGGVQDVAFRNSFDAPPPQKETTPTMRHDVLRSEALRHSIPISYPGRPTYKPAQVIAGHTSSEPLHVTPPPVRHHSCDSSYDPSARRLSSTIDDTSELPPHHDSSAFRTSGSRPSQYDYSSEPEYAQEVVSPAPLNISGRGSSAMAGRYSPLETSDHWHHEAAGGYATSPSPSAPRGYLRTSPEPLAYDSHSSRMQLEGTELESPKSSYPVASIPPIPASLVPGIDPSLALELSSRINEERRLQQLQLQQHQQHQQQRRHTTQDMIVTPPRGRRMIEAPPPDYGQNSSPAYSTPQQTHDRSPIAYSAGPSPAIIKPRAISPRPSHSHSTSPNPHHTIRRKSISPAPPIDGRRLSGVPFGPDSFDALNPSLVSASSGDSTRDFEKNGKIIAHDGREIDPSDHLPMDTWAPEPEPKHGKPSTPNHYHSSAESHQTPPSGRRQLRIAGHTQPVGSVPPPQYILGSDAPSPPNSSGRNRLQKKANRQSAMPVMSGSTGSSPLAPLPTNPRQQDNFTPPRALPRSNTFDFPNENYTPLYGSSPARMAIAAPPIPAKIPLSTSRGASGGGVAGVSTIMSGALTAAPMGGGGGWGGNVISSELSLIEEIKTIEIGTGRARRHQSRY